MLHQWVGLPPRAQWGIIGPEFKITRLRKIQRQKLDLRLVKKASHFIIVEKPANAGFP